MTDHPPRYWWTRGAHLAPAPDGVAVWKHRTHAPPPMLARVTAWIGRGQVVGYTVRAGELGLIVDVIEPSTQWIEHCDALWRSGEAPTWTVAIWAEDLLDVR